MTEEDEKLNNNISNKEDEDKAHLTTKFFNDCLNKNIEIIFKDGEKIKGQIEWFDKWNIKLLSSEGTEYIIYRHAVKNYILEN